MGEAILMSERKFGGVVVVGEPQTTRGAAFLSVLQTVIGAVGSLDLDGQCKLACALTAFVADFHELDRVQLATEIAKSVNGVPGTLTVLSPRGEN